MNDGLVEFLKIVGYRRSIKNDTSSKLQEMYSNLQFCLLSKNGEGALHKNYFFWEFDAKPSSLSSDYRVLIVVHKQLLIPYVFILNEDMWESTDSIPHLYDSERIRLCLYYPSYHEWKPGMPLCDTIVPWALLWLYYYEEWLYSKEWKGGGKHPEMNTRKGSPLKRIRGGKQKNKKKTPEERAINLIHKIYEDRKEVYLSKNINRISKQRKPTVNLIPKCI